MLLDPLGNLGKMLVLLADVVPLRQVDKVDDGLGRQEEERVDDLNLKRGQSAKARVKRQCGNGNV